MSRAKPQAITTPRATSMSSALSADDRCDSTPINTSSSFLPASPHSQFRSSCRSRLSCTLTQLKQHCLVHPRGFIAKVWSWVLLGLMVWILIFVPILIGVPSLSTICPFTETMGNTTCPSNISNQIMFGFSVFFKLVCLLDVLFQFCLMYPKKNIYRGVEFNANNGKWEAFIPDAHVPSTPSYISPMHSQRSSHEIGDVQGLKLPPQTTSLTRTARGKIAQARVSVMSFLHTGPAVTNSARPIKRLIGQYTTPEEAAAARDRVCGIFLLHPYTMGAFSRTLADGCPLSCLPYHRPFAKK